MHAAPEAQVPAPFIFCYEQFKNLDKITSVTRHFISCRYMDNPVFVAMEMPRFETVIENTSSAVEQNGSPSDAETQRYLSEPVATDYMPTYQQSLYRPAGTGRKGAAYGGH